MLFVLTNRQEKELALEKSVNSRPPCSQVHFKRKINIGDFSEQRTLAYELGLADPCQKELLNLSAQDEQSLPSLYWPPSVSLWWGQGGSGGVGA